MRVIDKTTNSKIAREARDEIKRICEQLNEKEGKKAFKILIESFEVESES